MVFHNGSKYDYQFISKELAEEFERQFECLGENTGNHINLLVPINKELQNNKTVTCKIKFIDSIRFMSSSQSNLIDNRFKEFHNDKCADRKSRLGCIRTKVELVILYCLKCSKNHKKYFNVSLIKIFANAYEFSDGDFNKFCLV